MTPSAQADLRNWLNRLVPETTRSNTHTPKVGRYARFLQRPRLTATSLSIPVIDGKIALGTWPGIYLWEHRHYSGQRQK